MSEETEIYEFGDSGRFRLDPSRREFYRDGRLVPLRPQSFDLLVYLVTHPGVAIPKKDLLKAIWGNQQTGDGDDQVLKQLFTDVYRALEDTGDPKTIIKRKRNFTTFDLAPRQVPRPSPEADSVPQPSRVATDRKLGQRNPPDLPPASKTRGWFAGLFARRRTKVVTGLIVGILGLMLWGLGFRPELSVTARDVPMSFDPFADQFAIQNQSSFTVSSLELGCYGLHFHAESPPMVNPQTGVALVPTTEFDRSEIGEDDVAPYLFRDALEPGGTVYIPCRGIIEVPYRFPPETPGNIAMTVRQRAENQPAPEPKLKLTHGDVIVFVQYRMPFVPIGRRASFRFTTRPGSDGKYHWMPSAQPINKVVTEVHGHLAPYTHKIVFGNEAVTDASGGGKP